VIENATAEEPAAPAAVPLRHNREFTLLWSGQALSELGSQISTVAYPLLVLALTGSPAKAGIVGLAANVPVTALALPAGVLADRLDRKRLMIAADGIRALAMAVLALAISGGHAPYALIVAVALIDSSGSIVSGVAERGAMRRLVAPTQLGEAVALNESRSFGAMLAGPPVGGLLFALGRAIPFLAGALSYAASTATKLLISTTFQEDRGDRHPGSIWDGVRWIWRQPFLRACALMWTARPPILTGLPLLVVVVARRHHASSPLIGVMLGIAACGGLAGALLTPRLVRRLPPRLVVVGENWVIAAAIPLLLLTASAPLLGLILAAATMTTPVSNAVIIGYRVTLAPDHLQGRVNAASIMVSTSLAWLGPLLVGLLVAAASPDVAIATLCASAAAIALAATAAPALRHPPALPHAARPAL
jgi:MFS family permease